MKNNILNITLECFYCTIGSCEITNIVVEYMTGTIKKYKLRTTPKNIIRLIDKNPWTKTSDINLSSVSHKATYKIIL